MTRTRPFVLIIAALIGLGVGFVLDTTLVAAGSTSFFPHVTLPILLVLLGLMLIVVAWPIARATKGVGQPVNPFRAVRVVALAKASSVLGALMVGFSAGLLLFGYTRPVIPSLGLLTETYATVVAALLLTAAALWAEYMCTLRKDDDDAPQGDHPRAPSE